VLTAVRPRLRRAFPRSFRPPGTVSYGELKLLPCWDPVRGDPRFEKLVEESKKPIALK
jgi:hypothetical protein